MSSAYGLTPACTLYAAPRLNFLWLYTHGMAETPKPSNLVQLGAFTPIQPVFQIDPVCKMRVLPGTAAGKFEYQGVTYYFCAPRCLDRFRADPASFLKPEGAKPK